MFAAFIILVVMCLLTWAVAIVNELGEGPRSVRRSAVAAGLVCTLAVVLMLIFYSFVLTAGGGYRDGQLQKFSHKGVIWTTDEGELLQGGSRNGVADVWQFSSPDASISAELNALPVGSIVRLHYIQERAVASCRQATNYRIVRVERRASPAN
jgi:hypothetical protein